VVQPVLTLEQTKELQAIQAEAAAAASAAAERAGAGGEGQGAANSSGGKVGVVSECACGSACVH
jgi:hypothetical protein